MLGEILTHGTFDRLHFAAVILAGTAYAKCVFSGTAHTQWVSSFKFGFSRFGKKLPCSTCWPACKLQRKLAS